MDTKQQIVAPRTSPGRKKSTRNSTRHGVLARTVVLHTKPQAYSIYLLTPLQTQIRETNPINSKRINTMTNYQKPKQCQKKPILSQFHAILSHRKPNQSRFYIPSLGADLLPEPAALRPVMVPFGNNVLVLAHLVSGTLEN